jgi:D-amino-acid oxidase
LFLAPNNPAGKAFLLRCLPHRDTTTPESVSPKTKIWWAPLVPSFEVLPPSSIPHDEGIIAGITYKSFCLFPSQYLQHLLSRCSDLGLKTHTMEVKSIAEIYQLPSCESAVCLVNCTGLSSKTLFGDKAMYPTKGQTVIVRGEAERISLILGGRLEASVIPRPGSGTSVLGGCKLAGDW